MFKKLMIAAVLLVAFSSCKTKTAFNYSEDFVKKESSLLPDINSTEDNVMRYAAAQQYDSIAIAGERMEKLVDVKLQEITKTPAPDVKDGQNFKDACIKYFGYIKSLYTGYKEYGLADTDEARKEAGKKISELSAGKQEVINEMQTAQKKFADANGFKLKN
ncbi:MAG TPA: hypothetical protein VHL77_12565 [Ferruginibacter sp.]|jgi:hypothetical protein|nr:hypothetical protein [Ferruginibacter sp.]